MVKLKYWILERFEQLLVLKALNKLWHLVPKPHDQSECLEDTFMVMCFRWRLPFMKF